MHWDIIVTLAVAVFGSTGFWSWMQNRSKKKSAESRLLMGIAYSEIIRRCEHYIHRGYIETEEFKELNQYLNQFLKDLSREDRYLFMRRYWYGDKISDIAQHLNVTAHKASVRLFRLRQKLQDYLKKEGMIA